MKSQNITPLILLFLLCISSVCFGYNLRQISNIENLSNNSIESMYQDKSGKLWIGTCDGLNYYNGREVSIYQPADKDKVLSGNIIDNILETDENVLWIQTYHGLNKLNRETNSVKYYNEFKQSFLMAKDKKNILYIIQDDNFIQYFDEEKEGFNIVSFPGVVAREILNFIIDKDNNMWIFYKNGQVMTYDIVYSKKSVSFKEIYKTSNTEGLLYCFYSNNDVMLVDRNYDLYSFNLHTRSKIHHYNLKEQIAARGEISSIIRSSENIFIGYKTNGVQVLVKDEGASYIVENIPINCGVFSLLKDKYQDIIWIGTDGQGVYIYSNDVYTISSTKVKDYIAQVGKPIRALYKDDSNTLWIGTKGDGIIKIRNYEISSDLNTSKIDKLNTKNSKLLDNSVYCIAKSQKDVLWVGTEYGLNYYSYKDNQLLEVPVVDPDGSVIYIHDVYEQDSTLWLATVGMGIVSARITWQNGHPKLDKIERITINNQEHSSNYFFSIYPENDSTIWVANRGYGAFKLNTRTSKYEIFSFSKGKNDKTLDEIFCITKDRETMYFGTSAGLIEYKSKDNYRVLDNNYGFPNNTIHSILKDDSDESFWLSTNKGLVNYNPQSDTFRSYGLSDGLNIIEFSDGAYYKDIEAGIICFGGVNGFVSVQKNRAYSNEYMPQLTFDALSIFGIKQNINDYLLMGGGGDVLKLQHTQNFISIGFEAIDFLNANNYSFQYKIEGANENWIDNGNSNSISLTNLNHGEYKLHVKYVNRVISKTSPEYILCIKILPPWYLSWLAYMVYGILVILALVLFAKYIGKRNDKKRRRLIRRMEAQHKEEVYESKLRFFTSIAHEFCTPLTLIYGPCNQILEQKDTNLKTKKYAQVILRNAERLNTLIQDIIEFRKIETNNKPPIIEEINVTEIINNIVFSFKELADTTNAKFYKKLPYELIWNSDKNYIITIVTNLLSNAFKYMSDAGSVEVEAKELDNTLVIKISNTGKGIKKQDLDKIFDRHLILDDLGADEPSKLWTRNGLGLAISMSMTENLNGTITIDSIPNEWTHFTVTIPYQEKSEGELKQNIISPITIPTKTIENSKLPVTPFDKTKKTILVIDDEIDILWFISDIFSDEYNVITLSSPLDVEKTLDNIHPNIIFCDINMPGLDGIELTSSIKSDKNTAHIPLIIISAKQGVEEQIRGMNAGAELYITKPFDVNHLKTSVKGLMDRKEVLKEYFSSPLSAFEMSEGQLVHNEDNKLIRDIQKIIDANITNSELNVAFIAKQFNCSTRNLYRRLSDLDSISISDMIRNSRLHIAETKLLKTKKTIDEIIFESGFTNRVSFYNTFSKKHKCTPSEFRDRAE